MTREEILALPAGRELDKLIAEKVMGWRNMTDDGWGHISGDPPAGYVDQFKSQQHCEGLVPYYSSDIAAAWEVLEHARLLEGAVLKRATVTAIYPLVCDCTGAWVMDTCHPLGYGDTAPLAICRAALVAKFR